MREFKFRAWDNHEGRMLEPSEWAIKPSGEIYSASGDCLLDRIYGDYTIMQYIGLKDGNGNDVYEGDILECYEMRDSNIDYWGCTWHDDRTPRPTFVVYWNEDYVSFEHPYDIEYWHIIGNIYEHPELIK
jgi:uncharacterized phage protein (TIGR01671 family)